METCEKYRDKILNLSTHYFVDIGASCVSEQSQTEFFISRGFSGILVECNPQKYAVLNNRYAGNPNVKIVTEPITPHNVISILKYYDVPNDFYLSLDIDGYDYFVLEQILKEYKPALIISEINEKIPASVKFSVNYTPNYFWDGTHYYGYSIGMLEDLLETYGYMIDCLDLNNVVLIPGKQEQSIEDVYNNGYLNTELRHTKFQYNADFNPVYGMNKEQQVQFIKSIFDLCENESQPIRGHQLNGIPVVSRSYTIK
jgi:hypothetical protein